MRKKRLAKSDKVAAWLKSCAKQKGAGAEKRKPLRLPGCFGVSDVLEICRLARKGNPVAVSIAWSAGTQFAQTILEIAEANPELLHRLARSSRWMPSLLSCSTSFNKSAASMAQRLKLSGDCGAGAPSDLRLESPITKFLIPRLDQLEKTRQEIQHCASVFGSQPKLRRAFLKLPRYLVDHLVFDEDDLRLLKLDALSDATVETWWTKVLKPEISERGLDSIRGTPLYKELCRKNRVKDYQVIDELKRRCHDALRRRASAIS